MDPTMQLSVQDCSALIDALDKVPTVGLNTQRRNLMLEQKLYAIAKNLQDAATASDGPPPKKKPELYTPQDFGGDTEVSSD